MGFIDKMVEIIKTHIYIKTGRFRGVCGNLKSCLNISMIDHITNIINISKYKVVTLLRSKALKRRISKKTGIMKVTAHNKHIISFSQYVIVLSRIFFIFMVPDSSPLVNHHFPL